MKILLYSFLLFFLCYLIPSIPSYPQVSEDSILYLIKNSDGAIKDSLYYELYVKFMYDNIDKAKQYAEKVRTLALQQNNDMYYIKSLHALGFLSRREADYETAFKYYAEGLTRALDTNDKIGIVMLYNDMGIINYQTQQYDKAIDYYLKVIENAKKYNFPLDEAMADNNIATVYISIGNFSKALDFFLNCIEIKESNDLKNGLEISYINAGLCYIELEEYQKALSYFQYVEKNCVNCSSNIITYNNYGLGRAYYFMKNYNDALQHLSVSLQLAKKNNDTQRIISDYLQISQVYQDLEKFQISKKYLDSAVNTSINSQDNRNLLVAYNEYSKIFQKQNDFKSALLYKEKFVQLKDSLFKNDLLTNINSSFLAFQKSESDRVIQGKDTLISRNRKLILIAVIISLLLLVVLAFSYRTLTYRRQLSEQLNALVDIKTKELTNTNNQLVKSRQELDTFLYRTSHDIRGPIATLLGLTNLATMEAKDSITSTYLKRIDITAGKLNEVISRLTNVSQINSMPTDFTVINVYTVVNEIIEDIRKRLGMENGIHFILDGTFPEEIRTDKILLKIILTNLIENGFKFYDPAEKECHVNLTIEFNGRLDLAIADNGIGISPEFKDKIFDLFFVASDKRGTGLGLYQAMLATQKLSGEIKLESNKKPTCFKVSLPII
jgi:signal transduction histidine kinase